MYARLLGLFVFLVLMSRAAEGQSLSRISPISSQGYDGVYSSVKDSRGNLYVSALTQAIGSNAMTIVSDSIFNYSGGLLIKYDPAGKLEWMHAFEVITGMTVDKDDNLYAIYTQDQYSLQIAKMNPSGNIVWRLAQGFSLPVIGNDIIVGNDGNCYASANLVTSTGMLYKIDPTGKKVWVTPVGGQAIAFNNGGNIIVGGNLGSSVFVTEISSATGTALWYKQFGQGNYQNVISDLVVDASGNIYFGGAFGGTATFQNTTLVSAGEYDFFIAKLDPLHQLSWIKSMGSNKRDKADYILEASDGIVVSGIVGGNVTLAGSTLADVDKTKTVITRIKADGTVEWLKDFGYARNDDTWDIVFKMGYVLNAESDDCFLVAGNFIYDLVTPETTLTAQGSPSELTDSFVGVVSNGTPLPPVLGPDIHLTWCDSSSVKISITTSVGANDWIGISGRLPAIHYSNAGIVEMDSIAYGITVVKLIKEVCGATSEQVFTLVRVKPPDKPAVNSPYIFCSNNLAQITIPGDSINWYQDAQLVTKISEGNSFNPSVSATVYVTDKITGCESQPSPVNIIVKNPPLPPVVTNVSICSNTQQTLQGQGSNLKWYENETSRDPILTGDKFNVNYSEEGKYQLFVTQTVNDCESEKSNIQIVVSTFDLNDVFLSNVVTANGDGLNDFFYLQSFDSDVCLGNFKYVKILNRWGEIVFYSEDRDFKWEPNGALSGVYFYCISFALQDFKSPITILK